MKESIIEIVTILGIFGIPSVFAMTSWCVGKCVKFGKDLRILMEAQQAQMRSELLRDYHIYMDDGYISEDDMKEWDNRYKSYHALGQNGVLDVRYQTLLKLPSKPNDADKSM